MRKRTCLILSILVALTFFSFENGAAAEKNTRLRVITTLSDYAALTRIIGGDRISVDSIVHSVQDPHHIRPKPSFVQMVRDADVLISTGLDLEMWLPTVINKSGNKQVVSGEIGYVAVSQGIKLVEIPKVISQIEGDVHIFGNPHLNTSPINTKKIARNIAIGLIKNDPEGKDIYEENLKKLHDEMDIRMFGEELVKLLGGNTLCRLAQQNKLIEFLQQNKFQGKPLIDKLGGWMKKMLPLRGKPIIVYHKNWSYFIELFGLEEAGSIETKPGIPPSLKHVTKLVNMMRKRDIRIILAANYFDEQKVRTVADRTGAKAVVVPLFVGGAPGIDDYFELVDYWTDGLIRAAEGS
ncbi:MAG: zinc ABC transporter substrate-binding protein [Desulfobacteraceae bacterium]|nr:zinc ABC transporter substrate-binding protein [Desulfobacteraceae bacterium]